MQFPLTAVCFDHDGTLVDSETVHCQFWQQVLSNFNIEYTVQDYCDHYVGVAEKKTAASLIERFSISASIADLVAEKQRLTRVYHQHQSYPLLPAVRETLELCKRKGLRLALVSGSERFALEASLADHGIGSYFECVVSGAEMPNNKPAPDAYLHALRLLQIAPQQAVAVEDTYAGVTAARTAGLYTFAIPNEYSRSQDFSGAQRILTSMHGFASFLRSQ